jgi:hypothetical protein
MASLRAETVTSQIWSRCDNRSTSGVVTLILALFMITSVIILMVIIKGLYHIHTVHNSFLIGDCGNGDDDIDINKWGSDYSSDYTRICVFVRVTTLSMIVKWCYCVGSTAFDEGGGDSYSGSFGNGDILKVNHLVGCYADNCDDKYRSTEIMAI